jgi:hypothetical protein
MFHCIMAKQTIPRPMDDRVSHHHFGIEQRIAADLPVKEAAVPIGPVDHGSSGENRTPGNHRLTLTSGLTIEGRVQHLAAHMAKITLKCEEKLIRPLIGRFARRSEVVGTLHRRRAKKRGLIEANGFARNLSQEARKGTGGKRAACPQKISRL